MGGTERFGAAPFLACLEVGGSSACMPVLGLAASVPLCMKSWQECVAGMCARCSLVARTLSECTLSAQHAPTSASGFLAVSQQQYS